MWGLAAAFLISLVVVVAGAILIYNDNNIEGFVLIIGDLAILAGVFVYSKRSQSEERLEKLEGRPS